MSTEVLRQNPWFLKAAELYHHDPNRYRLPQTPNWTNDVALYPPESVIKKSRDRWRSVTENLRFEAFVLSIFEGTTELRPVTFPTFLDYDDLDKDEYLRISWVDGVFLPEAEFATLPEEDLIRIGTTLGETIFWISQQLSPETYVQEELNQFRTISYRREQATRLRNRAGVPTQLQAQGLTNFSQVIEELTDNTSMLQPLEIFNGHNDLRSDNLGLGKDENGNLNLRSVIDFGSTQPSSPEEEMRFAYTVSQAMGDACARRYEEVSGERLDRDILRIWAIAEAALPILYYIDNPKRRDPSGLINVKNRLKIVLPDTDWSELDKIQPTSTK